MTLRDARLSEKKNFSGPIFFSALFFETQRSPALQKKTTFQALKKLFFFPRCSFETQRRSALQKNNFSDSKKLFFAH